MDVYIYIYIHTYTHINSYTYIYIQKYTYHAYVYILCKHIYPSTISRSIVLLLLLQVLRCRVGANKSDLHAVSNNIENNSWAHLCRYVPVLWPQARMRIWPFGAWCKHPQRCSLKPHTTLNPHLECLYIYTNIHMYMYIHRYVCVCVYIYICI